MPHIDLSIEELLLDQENPRSTAAANQREALKKIIDDQDVKLAELAESIIEEESLNPMDRMLVLKASDDPRRFIVLEGNRRAAALRILVNPAVLGDLGVRAGLRRRFEALAERFDRTTIEPIAAFEVGGRDEARYWIRLRHTGENNGRGVVGWSATQQARFRGSSPELQAVDFVREHGNLTDDEKHELQGRYITTVKRLLEAPDVRRLIGVEIKDGKLLTDLPREEIIKPLRRIVLDLALKRKRVTELKRVNQMVDYVRGLGEDLPDLTKSDQLREIDEVAEPGSKVGGRPKTGQKTKPDSKRRGPDPANRKRVVPTNCRLNVTDNRAAAIYKELRTLTLEDTRNAIAVLLRVFLEMSVDHYMRRNGLDLTFPVPGRNPKDKSLRKKIQEAVEHMVANGADRKQFTGMLQGLSVESSPLYVELLNAYVHSTYVTPMPGNLTAAWDNAQGFFEKVWS